MSIDVETMADASPWDHMITRVPVIEGSSSMKSLELVFQDTPNVSDMTFMLFFKAIQSLMFLSELRIWIEDNAKSVIIANAKSDSNKLTIMIG